MEKINLPFEQTSGTDCVRMAGFHCSLKYRFLKTLAFSNGHKARDCLEPGHFYQTCLLSLTSN